MKTLNYLKKLTAILLLTVAFTSCSDDDNDIVEFVPTESIVDIAFATQDLSDLYSALTKYPDLVDLLSNSGNFTVFAPNNDAFDDLLVALGQTSIDDIPEDVLKNVLQYHVFTGAALEASQVMTGTITMASGEDADVVADTNGVTIANATVVAIDGIGTNGVVHIIDSVMVPPSILPIVGTIVAPAYFNKNFSTLIAAVQAADPSILELLLGNGPTDEGLTLFAPTNDAFTAAGITDLADVAAVVNEVLAYHVVNGTVLSTDLPFTTIASAPIPTLLEGSSFYLTNKEGAGSVSINGTTQVVLEAANITASNGVVHVIDKTLVPPTQDIVDIVVDFTQASNPQFTLLAAALTKANLISALQADGPITVFAPTDAAFLAAGVDQAFIDAATPAQLQPILLHHAVEPSVAVFSSDVADGAVPMLNGTSVTISGLTILDGGGNTPAANLITDLLNVHATNGVIHVIDKVLLP
ncbi:MAG: fasciclin domain-containing protein [Algibacter sp.]|uniref:fasciclin domain-containing protein n=1 Tax=Algibacter sp. TaxID=1872428 RepID=UPI00260F8546|nr:fasciclin domain-containing protein [Algibacter sp.]MDG1729105.1 fasciclin domain-containing protein [Algibacter sp.]MDG2179681.1 fasciclin domain-containing protein [Algibacter sp.]